jgi:hypothetical protein
MGKPLAYQQVAAGTSNMVKLTTSVNPFNVTIAVVITGTASAKVQYTVDDPASASDTIGTGLAWVDHATLVSLSATAVGNLAYPVTAVRTVVASASAATITTSVLQAGF